MDHIRIYISFVAVLLGAAYPIIIQAISNLDEKYSSIFILQIFKSEIKQKWFTISLVVCLVCIFIWTMHFQPLFEVSTTSWLNIFVNKSAVLLVIITTIILISYFIYVVNVGLKYHNAIDLVQRFQKKHINDKEKEYHHFRALSDILFYAVRNQNVNIVKTISEFYYQEYEKIRKKHTIGELKFPPAYYDIVYKIIEELMTNDDRKFSSLAYRSAGGIWLLGEFKHCKISEETYYWLWRNLAIVCENNRNGMIMYFWKHSHRYMGFQLSEIDPEYSFENFEITNQAEIEARVKERERFLEFFYALGGLLLYRSNYDCLERCLNYSTSIPEKYELLPSTMDEIFSKYMYFRDPYNRNNDQIRNRYFFPQLEGINADGIIGSWICKYTALLFLRQYQIQSILITDTPLAYPKIPVTQRERKWWIENLEHFKNLVTNHLVNQDLMKQIKLDFLTKEWCKENSKTYPLEFIDKLKTKVQSEFEKTRIEQTVSDAKVSEFVESTKSIIKRTFEHINQINNKNEVQEDYNKRFIFGEKDLFPKEAFNEEQGVSYLDTDKITAQKAASKVYRGLSEIFFTFKSQIYLIKYEEIFQAIRNLGLTEKYIIVAFVRNIDHYDDVFDGEQKIDGVDSIVFTEYNYHLLEDSFFIMKKEDLPKVLFQKTPKEQVDKYDLTLSLKSFNLFTSIVDLNTKEVLREEILEYNNTNDLKSYVLASVDFKCEFRISQTAKIMQIMVHQSFSDRGAPNHLKDIKRLT